MRCNWRRWLWGVIPLAIVGWVAIQFERDPVQQDLAERARAALLESGVRWARVEVNGRDLVLTGRAIEDGEPPRAEKILRKVWGVRDVDNRAILPPKVEPFVWSARRRGNRISLGGYVSDRATRHAVLGLTKAAMPGVEVVDRMNTARGVPSPDTWLAGLSFALKQLSQMKRGDARFDDLALTISGEAEDTAAFKALNLALKSGLPKGTRLASAHIAPPAVSPFTWSAQFAGGQLVMAGHVAGGEKTRADLLAAAKTAAPAGNAVDRMELAEGAPPGWAEVAIALIKELVRLESGTIEMKDATLTVAGVAHDEPKAQSIRAGLRATVPPAFALVDQIKVREARAPEVKGPEVAPSASSPPLLKQSEAAPGASQEETPTISSATPVPRPHGMSEQSSPLPEPPQKEPAREEAAAPLPAPAPEKQATPARDPRADAVSKPNAPAAGLAPAAAPHSSVASESKAASEPQAAPEPNVASDPKATSEPKAASEPQAVPEPKVAAAPRELPAAAPAAPEVTTCQQNLNIIAKAGHIFFGTDSATLDAASFETLNRLAAAAKACPGVRIAIEGHTDAEGTAEYNQRLSVRRARAVAAYLVKAGADRKQLEAVGYGPTRPAAPNDSEENMAKNRRIEFSVRQQ
jgi:OmpA-OmpF porin, OOP family